MNSYNEAGDRAQAGLPSSMRIRTPSPIWPDQRAGLASRMTHWEMYPVHTAVAPGAGTSRRPGTVLEDSCSSGGGRMVPSITNSLSSSSSRILPAPMPDESMGRRQSPPPIPAQAAPPRLSPVAPATAVAQGPLTTGLFDALTEVWQGVAGGARPSSSGQGTQPPMAEASRESVAARATDAVAQARQGREENDLDQQGPSVPCDAGLLEQIPLNEDGELTSIGSIGHGKPGVECSPCAFWIKGMCILGVECQHCHFLHAGQKDTRHRPNKATRWKTGEGAGAGAGDGFDFEPGDREDFSSIPFGQLRGPVESEPRKAVVEPPPCVVSMPSCMPRQGSDAGIAPEKGQHKATMSL